MSRADQQELLLPVVALRNMVMFPGVVSGLRVGRPRSVAALERAMEGDGRLALFAQREAEVEEPDPSELYEVGVIAHVQAARPADAEGVHNVVAAALTRCRALDYTRQAPYLEVRTECVPDADEEVPEALRRQVATLYAATQEGRGRSMLLDALAESAEMDHMIAFQLDMPVAEKQELLAEPSPLSRYRTLVPVLQVSGELARTGERFWRSSQEEVTDTQREQYLRERKEEVERQLAELGGEGAELAGLRKRLDEADLPEEARREAERELANMARMPSGMPGYAVAEDFVDWLLALPWHESTAAVVDLKRAREVLERDHYDRREVKERILEYLSVRKLNPEQEGAVLCFVGAPGVGKTSMGRAIADATGRRFYRVALGGIRDEAEIRGHRRTYLGALPGCIIRALRRVGVNNPVLMLDEIDKLAGGLRGDPAGALLEVLDPDQNDSFVDNYVSVPFDLSRIMFIGTANTVRTISPILLDRLEVLELPGYTTAEKVAIASRYLVPKQVEAAGLEPQRIEFEPAALELLAERYTREAGVRNLERQVASICRKLAREHMGGKCCYRHVDVARVEDLLGPPRYFDQRSEKLGRAGVCPTLAVSAAGAGLLLVEVLRVAGKGKLTVTGRVGEVMGESASLAFSFWKGRAAAFGLDGDAFAGSDFHVHFPGGERPREGTMAGLAIALALASALAQKALPDRLAALGEITLHGRALPVDRVAERLAAAERTGIDHVILPERNRPDVEGAADLELPPSVKLSYISSIAEAVAIALPGIPAPAPAAP